MSHPPVPKIVHELTSAPTFVGRNAELELLQQRWTAGFRGVLALVGLGGTGKTAIAARFVQQLLSSEANLPSPDGIFVWSFYRDPDAGLFLGESLRYFSTDVAGATRAAGLGILHQLIESVDSGGPHLMVMDGLERMQSGSSDNQFGRLDDPLLKSFLLRIASGQSPATVLITSRFPITDLAAQDKGRFEAITIRGLDTESGVSLLRHRGVRADNEVLASFVQECEGHALTLDHLGGLVSHSLKNDPSDLSQLLTRVRGGKDQSQRLGRLLRSYENHLPRLEIEVLSKLCLFRGCMTQDQAIHLILCQPPIRPKIARDLADAVTRCLTANGLPEDESQELGRSVADTIESLAFMEPTAGPASKFRQDLLQQCQHPFQMRSEHIAVHIGELFRLYQGREMDPPDDQRPLSDSDREWFVNLCARYAHLHEHPAMPFQDPASQISKALQEVGYFPVHRADVGPGDIMKTLREVQKQLLRSMIKHFALRQVRKVCRAYQKRWTLAGPLAALDAPEIAALLDALAARHLVLRQADGTLDVHPAVRDYFRQRVTNQDAWHEHIRDQLVSLVGRPGGQYVEEKQSLDLVEEAIFHAVQTGNHSEAFSLYENVLGGHPHLAWKLGEVARGLRVLKLFPECPDRWAMAWYLRCLGELPEAFRQHTMAYFRADICLLQGRLPEVAAFEHDEATAVADFLMGKKTRACFAPSRCAMSAGQLYLYRGQLVDAQEVSQIQDLYGRYGWEGDRSRCLLVLAEVALHNGQYDLCQQHLESASSWIVHSGSMEHLCYLHLVRTRIALKEGDDDSAHRALQDGLHVATQCGFRLMHIELLCESARLSLATRKTSSAVAACREAYERARDDDCQFAWGICTSGYLLGHAMIADGQAAEAKTVLQETVTLGTSILHPQSSLARRMLDSLS